MANKLLGYALTSDEVTPGWAWLMKHTRCEMAIKSQSTAAVHEAAETLLQTLAARLNRQHNLAQHDRIFPDDIRNALAAAMAESVGPGVVIVWWDEVNGLQVNVAGTR